MFELFDGEEVLPITRGKLWFRALLNLALRLLRL